MRGAQLFGVVDSVGQDQAAFGVGVQDLDGLAGHGGLDVAGFLGFAAGHVFGAGDDADDFDVRLQLGKGAHYAQHGGAAGHVVLHFFHALGGLDGDAAGIEGDRFADQANDWGTGFRRSCRRVGDDDHARWFGAALGYAQESAHFQVGDALFVEDV